jgi:hypothetical protein
LIQQIGDLDPQRNNQLTPPTELIRKSLNTIFNMRSKLKILKDDSGLRSNPQHRLQSRKEDVIDIVEFFYIISNLICMTFVFREASDR